MTTCTHRRNFFRRGVKRERMLKKLANMRAAKARKREFTPPEREPKLVRYYPLEIGVRDKRTGDTAFVDLRSVRDAAKRLSVVLKNYESRAGSAGRTIPFTR